MAHFEKTPDGYHPDLNKTIDPRIIVEINIAYQILVK